MPAEPNAPRASRPDSPFPPIGALPSPDGSTRFRVWARGHSRVEVVLDSPEAAPRLVELPPEPDADGYFSASVPDVPPGARYRYRLDGDDARVAPDPASRSQPEGVHGPSEVVDPAAFAWTDGSWPGLDPDAGRHVLYEMHVGTFTPEGTFDAAAARLPALAGLGVTAVELMPVAEFAGSFGWGYDGVALFAPYHVYGPPDALRRFVDRAHALGLGVILDVVYNHFGPDGTYHRLFAPEYFHHEGGANEWGESLNYDGPHSAPVRDHMTANAAYWIAEFHMDGLRLDATQAIHDTSGDHLIAAIARAARAAAGSRPVLIHAENEPQDTRIVRPAGQGGHGLDGLWNDDFHHAAVVALTGRAEAYYADFEGSPRELAAAVRHGFLYQGQHARWTQKRRGTPTCGLPASAFLTYLENHDQVANSSSGRRLHQLASPGAYRAMVALWLLAPQTPLIFQGQEFGRDRPFPYFADHAGPTGQMVRDGRRENLSDFRTTTHPDIAAALADPVSRAAFEASVLDHPSPGALADNPHHALFSDLLALRRDDPTIRLHRSDLVDASVIGPWAIALRYTSADPCDPAAHRLLLVNLDRDLFPACPSEPLLAPPSPGHRWDLLWYSERPRYGGTGVPPIPDDQPFRLPGRSALLLAPAARTPDADTPAPPFALRDPDIHPQYRKRFRFE